MGKNMTRFLPEPYLPSSTRSRVRQGLRHRARRPGVTQTAFTRVGSDLTLNPPNHTGFDQSTIPYYNLYFSDTWRIKPTLTLSYGLGWTLEMPPTGKERQADHPGRSER